MGGLDPPTASLTEPPQPLWVVEQAPNRIRDRLDRAAIDEQAGLTVHHRVDLATRATRHNWPAPRGGLEEDQPKAFEAAAGIAPGTTRIVTVATETARAVLKLFDFENMSPRLWGMMWGAEDLAASLGASRNRSDGRYHSPGPLPTTR